MHAPFAMYAKLPNDNSASMLEGEKLGSGDDPGNSGNEIRWISWSSIATRLLWIAVLAIILLVTPNGVLVVLLQPSNDEACTRQLSVFCRLSLATMILQRKPVCEVQDQLRFAVRDLWRWWRCFSGPSFFSSERLFRYLQSYSCTNCYHSTGHI